MIYLIRHGQTEWNVALRMQGRKDSPLTHLGKSQATAVGRTLKTKVNPSNINIFSSPLGRAVKTSQIICKEAVLDFNSVIMDPRLVEMDFGAWEGLNEAEIENLFPGELSKRKLDKWNYKINNGETYETLSIRVKILLQQFLDTKEDVIIVTHDLISKVMRGLYLNLSPIDILKLDKHPQNRIFVLENTQVSFIDCEIKD